MKKFKATDLVKIGFGKISINESQAKPRLQSVQFSNNRVGNIKKTKTKGIYTVIGSVQFKAGEVFGWDGDASRMDNLIPIAEEKAK